MNKDNGQFLDIELILKKADIQNRMIVADLGCGSHGYFVFPLSKLVGKQGIVYAVDIVKSAIENIERLAKSDNLANIKLFWSNLEIFNATKIENGSLDRALLINALHQSENRVTILRETIRMMKQGAKMIIVEWAKSSAPFGPEMEKRVNLDLLKVGAKKLGLELEQEFNAGDNHFGLVYTKL